MLVLSNFATGDRKQGRDNPFRCFKDEKSLVSYFQRMKKLLVFFSRVAYREGGHFTVRAETDAETVSPTSERQEYPQLPQDIIRPTDDQRSMEPQKYVLWGIGRRWGPGAEGIEAGRRGLLHAADMSRVQRQSFQSPVRQCSASAPC
ncbi:hypothetical protein E4U27_000189 [Claviceps purpurea]|nr:hypothetical protein E4U27_000189 [Claviceps purpurea]